MPTADPTPRELLPPDGLAHVIDSPEGPIYYLDVGSGEPLLLVSAWGPQPGSTAWLLYRDVLAVLAKSRRCIVVELTNYGHTGPVTFHEPAHDVCVRAVVRVLDHLGIERITAVGTSQGATTCLDLALQHTGRVERLVIGACHASTGGDPYLLAPFPGEVMRLQLESQADPGSRDKLERLLRGLWYDESLVTAELVDELMAFRAQRMDHWQATQDSVSVPHSNVVDLPRVTVPTLVIHGRFDRMVPFEQALMIMSYLPSADVVVLNECGHWPPMERPDAFASLVLDFLARTSPAA
ncbi:Alpha/beta hydrolase-like protein [Frankia canadensis]|uniref:Alpha/beta hydrolase-like protein n=1 Tax=Frankia canadensis TaxID=1836972 RepID=A0A2I2KJN5_9ACTN|nr:alpha/beta hydrolase [Frankia canadensis]SNQ45865.1 Alpha/beta hydrolase-like protein [Frankia canadensis]SOU53155.1 Alpha/beta hydrolase-like protein [Frankia canadensis]